MIEVSGISTKARRDIGTTYRFRKESEVEQAVKEAVVSRGNKKPIYTGVRGIPVLNPTPKDISENMLHQQFLHNKTKGIRVREELMTITADEIPEDDKEKTIAKIADRFSDFYFDKGFQTAYGIYPFFSEERGEGYDILYAINAVSFRDGSKYIRNSDEYDEEVNKAARFVLTEITGQEISDEDKYVMQGLEYYGV